jgi:hypothetical protein
METTRKFWEKIKTDEFSIIISSIAIRELKQCTKEKWATLESYLNEIEYDYIVVDDLIRHISKKFVENRILRPKDIDDCEHIACSMVLQCDYIVSWNFSHIVNYKTQNGIKEVATQFEMGKIVSICTPEFFVKGDDENAND